MRTEKGTRLRRARWNLAVVGVAMVVLTSTTFWLANEGVLALPQAPIPAGTSASGAISSFTALTPSLLTMPQGQGANNIAGVLLGKVTVAAGFAPRLKVYISWLDPQSAGAVLNNPNAWLTFGIQYPIHTGPCTGNEPLNSQTIVDGATLCVALNTQGSGPLTYGGHITLSANMLSGYILVNALDPTSPLTCSAPDNTTTWCAPAGLPLNQNVFYITASVNTPGGIPPGQQPQLTTLHFYLGAQSS